MKQMWYRALAAFISMAILISFVSFDVNNTYADETPEQTVEDFVERGYKLMLGRESDEDGLKYWTGRLNSGDLNAAELITQFVESPEFKGKELSVEDTVEVFYQVMLSRESDAEGKAYWVDMLNTGFSIRHIVNGFSGSAEFKSLCDSYGITTGYVNFVESRDLNVKTTKFVSSCYQNILSRFPDADGLNFWTSSLSENSKYPEELIADFFYSPEGQEKIKDNSSFIEALYKSFLGRESDEDGKAYWMKRMDEGATRNQLFDEFKMSAEFAGILSDHDLRLRPTPTPTPTPTPKPAGKMVALTFDDGPYSPVTNRILDLLDEYDSHATFFVVGDRVATYASCVRRADELGCEIANHTYDHKNNLANVSGATIRSEIHGCNDEVFKIIGKEPVIMRPCGGSYSDTTRANVGMPMIIWSLDTADWKYRDATRTANAILNNVSDGDIILMHDLYSSTADAMEIVIPELVRRGYTLVTVSELAEAKGVDLEDGGAYYSIRGS